LCICLSGMALEFWSPDVCVLLARRESHWVLDISRRVYGLISSIDRVYVYIPCEDSIEWLRQVLTYVACYDDVII